MTTKTITLNIPEPGDKLPFIVLSSGGVDLEYDAEGDLCLDGGCLDDAAAALLGICNRLPVLATVAVTVSEVDE